MSQGTETDRRPFPLGPLGARPGSEGSVNGTVYGQRAGRRLEGGEHTLCRLKLRDGKTSPLGAGGGLTPWDFTGAWQGFFIDSPKRRKNNSAHPNQQKKGTHLWFISSSAAPPVPGPDHPFHPSKRKGT